MQFIGMLDSPCVRRVAVSPLALGLPFRRRSTPAAPSRNAEAPPLLRAAPHGDEAMDGGA